MPKYKIAVTLPLTLWVKTEADSPEEAIEKARQEALRTPTEEWGDDFSLAEFDIVNE